MDASAVVAWKLMPWEQKKKNSKGSISRHKSHQFGLNQSLSNLASNLWKIQTLDKASHNHSIGLSANILIVFHVRDPSDSTPLVFQTKDWFNLLKVISMTNINFIEWQCLSNRYGIEF